MRYAIRHIGTLAALALLCACGSFDGNSNQDEQGLQSVPASAAQGVTDEPVKIGVPFTVGDITYIPYDKPAYDEVGYAGYYGDEFAGKTTANGEAHNPAGATAAHKTLPMPSYVEVTALDTGRTILVRVNDRGPFANDRLINLSKGAIRQLGLSPESVAGVRVRRVSPPEQERAVLRQGIPAAERIETPESLLKILRDKLAKLPRPGTSTESFASTTADDRFIRESKGGAPRAITLAQTSPGGDYVVQVAALSSRSNADALAARLGASVTASTDGKLFRVRLGPFASKAEAQRRLSAVTSMGYPQARIYRD